MTDGGWLLGGRYRVSERIGAGGMAEVFRSRDELLRRDVAVKVFRGHHDPADSSAGLERQHLELRTLAGLNHPNLITLFDGSIPANGGPAYLVMELVDGPTLAARIAQHPLAEPEVRAIGAQIVDALAYVHAQGLVHRDVKPANILLGTDITTGDSQVRARLSDFGIVRLVGSARLTQVDVMVGTATYLAPEQARGTDVGPAADIYALGLVLLEAMTGERAYPGTALEAASARLHRSPEIPADLVPPWPALLPAMTALDPALRPAAAEVARILRGLTATGSLPVPPPLTSMGTELLQAELPPLGTAPGPAVSQEAAGSGTHRGGGRLMLAFGAVVTLAAVGAILILLRSGVSSSKPAPNSPAPLTSRTNSTSVSAGFGSSVTTQPSSQPATTQPPTSQPGTTRPPTSQPATTQPPTSQPPTTQPPTSASPSADASTTGSTTVSSPSGQSSASTTGGSGQSAGSQPTNGQSPGNQSPGNQSPGSLIG